MARVSPGGVGDGLPHTSDGEPLLHRWFVLAMIGLSLVATVLTVVVLFLTAHLIISLGVV